MDAAHKQALLNQHNHETTVDGLKTLLKNSEFEKEVYINECKEAKIRVSEFETKIQEMADELTMLKSTEDELRVLEKQLMEATSDKLKNIKQMEEMETQGKYIELLESELTQLRQELQLRGESELTRLETMRSELDEIRERENEAQVEIALLQAEIHKERSKAAAAEAAELKAIGEKSAAYFAVQQMAIETQEVKKENQRLQSEHEEVLFQDANSVNDNEITISLEEYENLVKKSEEAKVEPQIESKSREEIEKLKKDLESATAKVSEFRTRAEQATTRAEVAEQAKAALEEQVKEWKEQKQRRRAALAALRAESMSRSSHSLEYDDNSKTYMPLGKFLKMKQ
ncbi:hypothetical protein HanRHA438_Chr05g0240931 [Helianthus annuus]|uniref:WEB family n=2 Tax=Helianthus annuus TaxID=4232 RepID=A0A251UTB7_HELAN|nr:hypothetical protein HanXRQr2_Chr05g0231641 [Helianthus annuus]KAJ0585772.1 hypothetical protein HanHA89_Chr05g0204491 [Helianthus annuus]KAJ0920403.1 hypothetical protein HanRHA438_Chr05g0240931 [Helianthus annuus]